MLPPYARAGWAVQPTPDGVAVFRDGRRMVETDDLGAVLDALGPVTPVADRVAALAGRLLGLAADRLPVYVASPLAPRPGEPLALHLRWARALCRLVYDEGGWPLAPHLYAPQFLQDADPAERAAGMGFGRQWLEQATAVYAFTPDEPSPGMVAELARARQRGLPLRPVEPAELARTLQALFPGP